jgi:hypothetical protein
MVSVNDESWDACIKQAHKNSHASPPLDLDRAYKLNALIPVFEDILPRLADPEGLVA